MQSVQELDRNDRGPGHAPRRTNTKYVSEAFSFLDDEKYGNVDNEDLAAGYSGVPNSRSEPVLSKLGGISVREPVANGKVTTASEFTIVTTVEKSPVKKEKETVSPREINGVNGSVLPEITEDSKTGEYTIVTYADEKEPEAPMKGVKLPFPFNAVYIVNEDEKNETNQKEASDEIAGNTSKPKTEEEQKEGTERNSVIIEGEVVELRNSPTSPGIRKSRQPTWKKNQAVVSEAFGFLTDIDDIGEPDQSELETVQYENDTDINTTADEPNTASEFTPLTNDNPSNTEKLSVETLDNKEGHNVTSGSSTEAIAGENDEVGELVGGKIRQRPKPRPKSKPKPNSENADDDGDSSDDDKGDQ